MQSNKTTQTLIISSKLPGAYEAALAAGGIKPVKGVATVVISIYEPNKSKTTTGDIRAITSQIIKRLTVAGIIESNNPNNIDLSIAAVKTDKLNPRVEIKITGVI